MMRDMPACASLRLAWISVGICSVSAAPSVRLTSTRMRPGCATPILLNIINNKQCRVFCHFQQEESRCLPALFLLMPARTLSPSRNHDRDMHAGHIVIAHAAGYLVMTYIRRLEGVVNGLRGARRDGIQTDEHMIVLVILVRRLAIGIGGNKGKRVRLLALIAHHKIVVNAGMKGGDRGNNGKFDLGDMHHNGTRHRTLLYDRH